MWKIGENKALKKLFSLYFTFRRKLNDTFIISAKKEHLYYKRKYRYVFEENKQINLILTYSHVEKEFKLYTFVSLYKSYLNTIAKLQRFKFKMFKKHKDIS